MELSFSELVVLAVAASEVRDRSKLARDAADMYKSSKYDYMTALADVKNLEDRRFLAQVRGGTVLELTRDGWAAMVKGTGVIENVRSALGRASYRLP